MNLRNGKDKILIAAGDPKIFVLLASGITQIGKTSATKEDPDSVRELYELLMHKKPETLLITNAFVHEKLSETEALHPVLEQIRSSAAGQFLNIVVLLSHNPSAEKKRAIRITLKRFGADLVLFPDENGIIDFQELQNYLDNPAKVKAEELAAQMASAVDQATDQTLRTELEKANRQVQELSLQITEMKAETSGNNERQKRLQEKIQAQTAEITKLQHQIREKNADITELKEKESAVSEDEKQAAEAQISALKDEVLALTARQQMLQQSADEKDAALQELRQQSPVDITKTEKYQTLKAAYEESLKKQEHLQSYQQQEEAKRKQAAGERTQQIAQAEAAVRQAQQELLAAQTALSDRNAQVTDLQMQISKLKEAQKEAVRLKEEQERKLEAEMREKLTAELSEKVQQIAIPENYDSVESFIEALKKEKERAYAMIPQEVEAKLRENEEAQNRMQIKLEQAAEEMDALKNASRQEMDALIRNYETQLESMKKQQGNGSGMSVNASCMPIAGNGAVVIGIAAITAGAGATTTAQIVAQTLAEHGRRCALVGYGSTVFSGYHNLHKRIDAVSAGIGPSDMLSLLTAPYDYLVIDFGAPFCIDSCGIPQRAGNYETQTAVISEFLRSNHRLLVGHANDAKIRMLEYFAFRDDALYEDAVYLLTEPNLAKRAYPMLKIVPRDMGETQQLALKIDEKRHPKKKNKADAVQEDGKEAAPQRKKRFFFG